MPAPTEVGQGFRPKLLHEPENGEGTRPDLAPQRQDRRCTQHVADALNEATNLHLVTPPPHHLTLPRTKSPPSATDPRTTDTPPARTSDIGPGAAAPASSTFLEQIWSMATRGVGTDERRSHHAGSDDPAKQPRARECSTRVQHAPRPPPPASSSAAPRNHAASRISTPDAAPPRLRAEETAPPHLPAEEAAPHRHGQTSPWPSGSKPKRGSLQIGSTAR